MVWVLQVISSKDRDMAEEDQDTIKLSLDFLDVLFWRSYLYLSSFSMKPKLNHRY